MTDSKTPRTDVLELDSFLNEPPENEDKRTVRDYRYEAYAKWEKVSRYIRQLEAELAAANERTAEVVEWIDGFPPKPWADEWFIALTTFGDRVVLTALPEEYSYDFKTADETYILADRIKKWMPFPDSEHKPPTAGAVILAPVEQKDRSSCVPDSNRSIYGDKTHESSK